MMGKRANRRAFTPRAGVLERRRLLAVSALWLGQDGGDHVGTEGTLVQQAPNDYQDVHFKLTGLSGAEVVRVDVGRYGGGAWTWAAASGKNAMFFPSADSRSGDLYFEPYFADPAGAYYESIRVTYADGSTERTSATATTAVDPNLRAPGKEVSATFLGQVGQDWTNPSIAVGPDGVQDVRVSLANLSAGASGYVRITAATNPPRSWETGVNVDGRWNAELLDRPGASASLGTTADVYFSSDVDLNGVPLTVQVFYDHWNPDYRSYTNRSGKADSVTVIAGAVDPSRAMPAAFEPDLATVAAASLPQDAAYPGYSHAAVDAASLAALATPQGFGSVRSAVLSNSRGSAWIYVRAGAPAPYTGFVSPAVMSYDPASGVLSFPPARDEAGSSLTLRLTFDDGSEAVARFDGAFADLARKAVDTRVGASIQNVSNADQLLAAIDAGVPVVHMSPGVYVINRPIDLRHPLRLTADPGATLEFVLSSAPGSPWSLASGAIQVRSSHVALDGFAIRFRGTTADWNTWSRNVIQAGLGTVDVGLSFTNLDVVAPAAAVAGVYEQAVALMNFEDGDTGRIADNVLKGGWIQLGAAPWMVVGNDYRGALPDTISPTFLNAHRSFDITIQDNHAHVVAPAGITLRFLVMGNSDSGQGIGNVVEGNVIDGGIGTPATGAPASTDNNPEIILTETYQPRFEGRPSAVSADGYIVQVPHLRGPISRTGDVISILTGPHAGEWRMIAQALGPNRYLLTEPLPDGDYDIAIGRGYVDQVYRGNTIDLRGMSPNNIAMVIAGNHWGQVIQGNTFLGGAALRLEAGSNEAAFEGRYPAPWGWSRLPVFGLSITDNTFTDAFISIFVTHNDWASKASAGRTYMTADFSANTIVWTDVSRPAVEIGVGGSPAYTQAAFPWLTPEELFLNARDNVGGNPATGAPATMRIYAAMLNGEAVDDLLATFPAQRPVTAVSYGQDGRDHVGAAPGANAPDGLQDVHIVLSGLPESKAIARVVVMGAGGEWRYGDGPSWTGAPAALLRRGAWADLFIQPSRDTAGLSLTITVSYTDGTSSRSELTGLFASGRLLMPNQPAPVAPGVVAAPGPSPADTGETTDTTAPPSDPSGSVDLALGRPATSSSDEGLAYLPAAATDGDPATRWSSGQWMRPDQDAWLMIDLGAVLDVDRVRLTWEAAFALDYAIQTSLDAETWTTARTVADAPAPAPAGGVVTHSNLNARARYVRVAMTRYNWTKNYSLFDVNIYGV